MSQLSSKEFEDKLCSFVSSLADVKIQITADTALFDDGIIDSMKILDLIAFIEIMLDLRIADDQIVLDNFRSPRIISRTFLR